MSDAPRWPVTDEEWSEAIAAAVWALGVQVAEAYGLITGAPDVDVDRAEALLAEARSEGRHIPTLDEVLAHG